VATGSVPFGIAVTPDGKHVYVTNEGDDTVSEYTVGSGGALSPATGAPTVANGVAPYNIAVTPDGRYVYVSNYGDSTVSEYSVGTDGALSPVTGAPTVATGLEPWGIVVTPDSGPTAGFTYVPGTAGKPTSFSAQGTDSDEAVTGYAWSFGDGQTGGGQNVSHTYAQPGSYTVTLTETDSAGCSAYGPFAGNAGGFTGHSPYCALNPAAQVTHTVLVTATPTPPTPVTPPKVTKPLKLAVSPTRTHAGVRACFAFRASSTGHPVAGAAVRFAGHRARTSRAGEARICLRLRRGTYHPSATKRGYRPAHATVTVSAKPKPPRFTG
jgi:hypothetical protein